MIIQVKTGVDTFTPIDVFPDFEVKYQHAFEDGASLSGGKTPYTSKFKVPLTERNRDLFGVDFDLTYPTNRTVDGNVITNDGQVAFVAKIDINRQVVNVLTPYLDITVTDYLSWVLNELSKTRFSEILTGTGTTFNFKDDASWLFGDFSSHPNMATAPFVFPYYNFTAKNTLYAYDPKRDINQLQPTFNVGGLIQLIFNHFGVNINSKLLLEDNQLAASILSDELTMMLPANLRVKNETFLGSDTYMAEPTGGSDKVDLEFDAFNLMPSSARLVSENFNGLVGTTNPFGWRWSGVINDFAYNDSSVASLVSGEARLKIKNNTSVLGGYWRLKSLYRTPFDSQFFPQTIHSAPALDIRLVKYIAKTNIHEWDDNVSDQDIKGENIAHSDYTIDDSVIIGELVNPQIVKLNDNSTTTNDINHILYDVVINDETLFDFDVQANEEVAFVLVPCVKDGGSAQLDVTFGAVTGSADTERIVFDLEDYFFKMAEPVNIRFKEVTGITADWQIASKIQIDYSHVGYRSIPPISGSIAMPEWPIKLSDCYTKTNLDLKLLDIVKIVMQRFGLVLYTKSDGSVHIDTPDNRISGAIDIDHLIDKDVTAIYDLNDKGILTVRDDNPNFYEDDFNFLDRVVIADDRRGEETLSFKSCIANDKMYLDEGDESGQDLLALINDSEYWGISNRKMIDWEALKIAFGFMESHQGRVRFPVSSCSWATDPAGEYHEVVGGWINIFVDLATLNANYSLRSKIVNVHANSGFSLVSFEENSLPTDDNNLFSFAWEERVSALMDKDSVTLSVTAYLSDIDFLRMKNFPVVNYFGAFWDMISFSDFPLTAPDGGVCSVQLKKRFSPPPIDDSIPPTAPVITDTSEGTSLINVIFTPSTDNIAVTGYNIYRDGVLIDVITPASSYLDTGLTPDTNYSYYITAFDAAGNVSPQSNTWATKTTVPADVDPPVIGVLSVTGQTESSISFAWTPATDNSGVTGYTLHNVAGGVYHISGNETTFTVANLLQNTQYQFYLTAQDGAGNISADSNTVTHTTDAITLPEGSPYNFFMPSGIDSGLDVTGWTDMTFVFKGAIKNNPLDPVRLNPILGVTESSVDMFLTYDENQGSLRFQLYDGTTIWDTNRLWANDGLEHTFVFRYSATGGFSIDVDGVSIVNRDGDSGFTGFRTNNLAIAGRKTNNIGFYGSMKTIIVYDKELTNAEVADIFTNINSVPLEVANWNHTKTESLWTDIKGSNDLTIPRDATLKNHLYDHVIDEATLQGYTLPTAGQQAEHRSMITEMVEMYKWYHLDVVYCFKNDGSEDFGRINWCNATGAKATKNGGVTWDSTDGYVGDAAAGSYVDLGYSENAMPRYDSFNLQIDHFVSKAPTAGLSGYGCYSGIKSGTNELSFFTQISTSNVNYKPRYSSNPVYIGENNVEGLYSLVFDTGEAIDSEFYIDGTSVVTDAAAGAVVSSLGLNFYALGLNDGGSSNFNGNSGVAFWAAGESHKASINDFSTMVNDYVQNTLPCSAGTVGLSDTAGTSQTSYVGQRSGQVTMPKDGWLTTLYSHNSGTSKSENSCQMAVYTDSADRPGSLLAVSVLRENYPSGDVAFNLVNPIFVTEGTKLWFSLSGVECTINYASGGSLRELGASSHTFGMQQSHVLGGSSAFTYMFWADYVCNKPTASVSGNVVPNSAMEDDIDWDVFNGTTISGGKASVNSAAAYGDVFRCQPPAQQSLETYWCHFKISNYVSGEIRCEMGYTSGSVPSRKFSADGVYTVLLFRDPSQTFEYLTFMGGASGFVGDISDVYLYPNNIVAWMRTTSRNSLWNLNAIGNNGNPINTAAYADDGSLIDYQANDDFSYDFSGNTSQAPIDVLFSTKGVRNNIVTIDLWVANDSDGGGSHIYYADFTMLESLTSLNTRYSHLSNLKFDNFTDLDILWVRGRGQMSENPDISMLTGLTFIQLDGVSKDWIFTPSDHPLVTDWNYFDISGETAANAQLATDIMKSMVENGVQSGICRVGDSSDPTFPNDDGYDAYYTLLDRGVTVQTGRVPLNPNGYALSTGNFTKFSLQSWLDPIADITDCVSFWMSYNPSEPSLIQANTGYVLYELNEFNQEAARSTINATNTFPIGLTAQMGCWFDNGNHIIAISNSTWLRTYPMSTAYDLTSYGSLANVDLSTAGMGSVVETRGLQYRNGYVFIVDQNDDRILRYSFTDPTDPTTMQLDMQLDVSAYVTNTQAVDISPDGLQMIVCNTGNDYVEWFTLGTPWDITTAAFQQEFYFGGWGFSIQTNTIGFNKTGTSIWIQNSANEFIYQVDLNNNAIDYSKDYIVNGDFSGGYTGWTVANGTVITGGAAVLNTTDQYIYPLRQTLVDTLEDNAYYVVEFEIKNYVNGYLIVSIDGTGSPNTANYTGNGVYRCVVKKVPGAASRLVFSNGSPATLYDIDNVKMWKASN